MKTKLLIILIIAFSSCKEEEVIEPVKCNCEEVVIIPYLYFADYTTWKYDSIAPSINCEFLEGTHLLDSNTVYSISGRYKKYIDCVGNNILDYNGIIKE